jgi:hypothetical protein
MITTLATNKNSKNKSLIWKALYVLEYPPLKKRIDVKPIP